MTNCIVQKQNNLSILSNHFSIKRFHNVSKQLTSHPGFTISEVRKRQSYDIFKAAWFCRLTNNYSLLFTAVHVCELKYRESVFGNFCPIWLFVAGKSQRSRRHGFIEKSRFITVPNIFGSYPRKSCGKTFVTHSLAEPWSADVDSPWNFLNETLLACFQRMNQLLLGSKSTSRFTASCDAFCLMTWSVTIAPWAHACVNHCVSASLTSLCTDWCFRLRLVFPFICMQDLRSSSFLRIFAAVE